MRLAQVSLLPLSALLLLLLWVSMAASDAVPEYSTKEDSAAFWVTKGLDAVTRTLMRPTPSWHGAPAKNVIVFVGDGMGATTSTAARIYKGKKNNRLGPEGASLSWDHFPYTGLFKTYNLDKMVPDSAGTATAMFTGVKAKYGMLGMEGRASRGQCDYLHDHSRKLSSIMAWAQKAGKYTGFATTTRVTHATPAGLYAAINDRNWECDSAIPPEQQNCVLDIARQLVELSPGVDFRVILGGGLKQFGQKDNPEWDDSCVRTDGLDLVDTWRSGKENAVFVRTASELLHPNVSQADHLLGLFSPGNLPYALETNVSDYEPPTLAQMTTRAIQVLSKGPNGYMLMVEGGRIDHAHHGNLARMAMEETVEMDKAVEAAMAMVNPSETLVLVTADHSHGFTINGYPARGSDLFDFPDGEQFDTLSYATGPGADPSLRGEKDSIYHRSQAGSFLNDAVHGGEDVAVYATGAYSHLFTGVFEQNYLAHAIGYATCTGPAAYLCAFKAPQDGGRSSNAGATSYAIPSLIAPVAVQLLRGYN